MTRQRKDREPHERARLSQDATPANPMMIAQRISRARAVANSDAVAQIVAAAEQRTGRPRMIPLDAVFAAFVFHATSRPHAMTTAGVCESLKTLTRDDLLRLGIPACDRIRYKRVHSGWRAIRRVIERGFLMAHDHDLEADESTGEVLPCPEGCPYVPVNLDEILTELIQASIPTEFERPTGVAIDGTDIESNTRPHRKRVDAQGRAFWSVDHDARWGHRTATSRRPTELHLGYEAHVATYIPPVDGAPIPQLVAGVALRPGVRLRSSAAIAVLDALKFITEALLDRGYTTAQAEKLARLLRLRHIDLTMDLHKSQRGTSPGPTPGTIWIDGHLYSAAIPARLKKLDPPTLAMSEAEKAHLRDIFDAREPYRFVPHEKHNKERGSQRYRGPAASEDHYKVRCPNTPGSMRKEHHLPTTSCVKGQPCGCAQTPIVKDVVQERNRQRLPWQSTRWAKSFNRRTLVEGLFGATRYQSLNINRGFFRQTGLVATGLLLAVAYIGHNIVRLHAWHTTRGLPEPWQVQLGEPIDDRPLDKATRTRGRRKRQTD